MVLFGGEDSTGFLNDVWELSLSGRPRWRQLHPDGVPPSPRHRHTATLEPVNDRMLVFAGWDGWYTNDLWQLDFSKLAWSRLQTEGPAPPPRAAHTTVIASDGRGLIIFGGAGPVPCPDIYYCAQNTTDVWLLSLSDPPVWTNLTPSIRGPGPCGIEHHAAVYDPAGSRMIVIGGYADYGYNTCFGGTLDVWALSLQDLRWSQLPSGPESRARYFSSALYDPEEARILVYGGGGGTPYADVWALGLGSAPSWSKVAPPGGMPSYYSREGLHYDDRQDRLVSLAGNQLWSYSFRDGGEWVSVDTKGEPPPALSGGTEILDAANYRLILHGGWDGWAVHGETWQLSLDDPPTWSRLPTGGEDPPQLYAGAIYDPKRKRMIEVGGYRDLMRPSAEVWTLSLTDAPRWSRLETEGSLLGRAGHSAIYDERMDRLVIFGGGWEDADSWTTLNDVWALPLTDQRRWTQLSPFVFPPSAPYPRAFQSALYDATGNRMIVVGGWVPGAFARGPFDDAWEFRLDDAQWWRIPAEGAIPLWQSPHGTYDSRRDRFVFQEYDWLWTLQPNRKGAASEFSRFTAEATPTERVFPASEMALSLAVASSNPFAESFVVRVGLLEVAPALLELFDVGGRRVWSREVAFQQGGPHLVRASGLSGLRPGVYLLRLAQSHESRTVCLVHSE